MASMRNSEEIILNMDAHDALGNRINDLTNMVANTGQVDAIAHIHGNDLHTTHILPGEENN